MKLYYSSYIYICIYTIYAHTCGITLSLGSATCLCLPCAGQRVRQRVAAFCTHMQKFIHIHSHTHTPTLTCRQTNNSFRSVNSTISIKTFITDSLRELLGQLLPPGKVHGMMNVFVCVCVCVSDSVSAVD